MWRKTFCNVVSRQLFQNMQSQLGEVHKLDDFEERFLFATNQTPIWNDTIKGDENKHFHLQRLNLKEQ